MAIVAVVGTARSGKTYWAAHVLQRVRRNKLIISSVEDQTILEHVRLKPDRIVEVWAPVRRIPLFPGCTYMIPVDLVGKEVVRFNNELSVALRKSSWDGVVMIDEAHTHLGNWIGGGLISTIRASRHLGLDFVLVTHRLVDLATDFRAIFSHLVIFRTISDRDADLIYRMVDLPEDVRKLPMRKCIVVNLRTGEWAWGAHVKRK